MPPVKVNGKPDGAHLSDLFSEAREFRKIATTWAVQMPEEFEVETLEGTMKGEAGGYLCQGPKGERWPVKRDIFEATHIPV